MYIHKHKSHCFVFVVGRQSYLKLNKDIFYIPNNPVLQKNKTQTNTSECKQGVPVYAS